MLITKEVEVLLSSNTIKHYEDLGYDILRSLGNQGKLVVKRGTKIMVKVEDLMPRSGAIVEVLCDYCLEKGVKTSLKLFYREYRQRKIDSVIEKDCCKSCLGKKNKESNFINYGVESTTLLIEVQEKRKLTNINKYGVDSPMKSKETQEKLKKTMLEKYGVEYVMQSKEIRESIIQTNLDKYGVKNVMQDEEIKQRQMASMYKQGNIKSSKQQRYIRDLLGGELNLYVNKKCFVDIGFTEDKIYIEVDCSGHRLGIIHGQISEHDFEEREKGRSYGLIKSGWREIRIISLKDFLPSDEILLGMLECAKGLFGEDSFHRVVFDIDNNNVTTSKWNREYQYGDLRKVGHLNV